MWQLSYLLPGPYPAVRFDFTTTDATPPKAALALGRVAGDGFEILGASTKNGTVLWVVLLAGAPEPRFQDVKSGHAAGGKRAIANGNFHVAAGPLSLWSTTFSGLAI